MRAPGRKAIAGIVLFSVAAAAWPPGAGAQDSIRQYRAAIIRIFLWRYQAFPVFRLNPVTPGSVVRLANETEYLSAARCYGQRQADPAGVEDYKSGEVIATDAALKASGHVLSKQVAEIRAHAGMMIDESMFVAVSPLSIYKFKPDAAALRSINPRDADCQMIPMILDGRQKGFIVAASVLHGQIHYRLGLTASAELDAAARGKVIAIIAKVFAVNEAAVTLSGNKASVAVAASPGNKSLALVPEMLSLTELSRITNFLDGKRGADLEIAVREAMRKSELQDYEKAIIRIKSLLGDDEIVKGEQWAENFVSGEKMASVDMIRTEYRRSVNFQSVANYAAAMELLRKDQAGAGQPAPTK